VLQAIERGERGLEKARERGYSAEDVELLEKVVGYLREAVEDDGWRALAVREEVGNQESPQEMGSSPLIKVNSRIHTQQLSDGNPRCMGCSDTRQPHH
jgi:hypothetical protein